ncbi:MAG: metallophosphoesterase family protein [Alphaproteobacteria bacterium]
MPDSTRVYAIGDIHGRLDLLQAMHSLVMRDALEFDGARKVVVYLGDYVDRGVQSRETVDYLLDEPLAGFERVYLMGNHERTLLDFLVDPRVASSWMTYGGAATLYSYGVGSDGPRNNLATLTRLQENFRRNLPARHLRFFNDLRLSHMEGDYLFVHAGVKPGVPLGEQQERDLLWIRDEFLDSDENFGKIVVHGHTITRAPDAKANRIGIDTGAFASGKLTALALEGDSGRFLDTGTDRRLRATAMANGV